MYYIGIDAAGAYARLAACDDDMRLVGKHTGQVGAAQNRKENLTKLLYEFNKMTNTVIDSCKGLCIGVPAGAENAFEEIFAALSYSFPVQVVCDKRLMLAAHTNAGCGVVVYSGQTARGAALNEDGKFFTLGEYPKPIDDGASAYSMGLATLKAVMLAQDGRIAPTSLTPKALECLGVKKPSEIRGVLHSVTDSLFVEMGLLVKYASADGDNAALEIEQQAAASLAQIANALIKKSALTAPAVGVAGSVLLTNDNIQKIFTRLVQTRNKEAVISPVKEKNEMGALYLAMKEKPEEE